jgi:DNA sulfur modification protein DndE
MGNLHPSKAAHEFMEDVLAKKTGIRRNIWARIAVARSIALDDLPTQDTKCDSEGTELARHTILGDYDSLFKAMFILRYGREIRDDEFFPRLFKLHLERGVELLKQDWGVSGNRPDEFYSRLSTHLAAFEGSGRARIFHSGVKDLVRIEVGAQEDTKQGLSWELNKANNAHACIVGTTGSGKTQFVKETLAQISEQTDRRLPFVVFDYARGDVAGDLNFVKLTQANVVELPASPVPLVPLRPCKTDIEVSQQAHHLAKIFRDVAPQIGTVQEQRLIAAVRECYLREGRPPTFYEIRDELEGTTDSLTSVLGKLTDLHLFPGVGDRVLDLDEILRQSWIIDLHRLQELRELVVFLTLDAFRYHFGLLQDQSVNDATGIKELRSVIVIDEAHNFLPRDGAAVLEKCLRELRGKGVAVWLLTQNPKDLKQPDYNYGAEVNFHLCLKVLDAHPQTLSNLYGVPLTEARQWSARLATFEGEGLVRNPASARGFAKIRVKQFHVRFRK